MAFKADLKAENDVLLPAALGLAVTAVTVLALLCLRRQKFAEQLGGSRYVTSLDGSQIRRSTRSRKSVARWSPDDLASPTGYGTPKTPKTVVGKSEVKVAGSAMSALKDGAEHVAEKVQKLATPVVEAVITKKGPGRPPRTPAAKKAEAKTPHSSSPRQLRNRKTPAT